MTTPTKPRSNAQRAADHYDGSSNILVTIYPDEFIVYAQVSDSTAGNLIEGLIANQNIFTTTGNDHAAKSADGMTYVFIFGRSRFNHSQMDWLTQVMGTVAPIIERTCKLVLDKRGVMYNDNRQRDHNSVALFCSLLP